MEKTSCTFACVTFEHVKQITLHIAVWPKQRNGKMTNYWQSFQWWADKYMKPSYRVILLFIFCLLVFIIFNHHESWFFFFCLKKALLSDFPSPGCSFDAIMSASNPSLAFTHLVTKQNTICGLQKEGKTKSINFWIALWFSITISFEFAYFSFHLSFSIAEGRWL